MDDAQRREILARLNNLAWYVRSGYPLEMDEPGDRGRKGPSREPHRFITFRVRDVRRFDSIGWTLMLRDMRRQRSVVRKPEDDPQQDDR